jgi:hypothetical protein
MVISGIATSKNHIELLVPGQIRDRSCDPGQILVQKRPSTFSVCGTHCVRGTQKLRQHRNRKFLDDDQGCLSERTVDLTYSCTLILKIY